MDKDRIQKRINEIAEASERRARGELSKRTPIRIEPEEEPIKDDQPEPEVEEEEEEIEEGEND